uniref:Uncharacterized protein n=1 Tax=Arundo donax TaxID=35708 RepID=A0A0A9BEV7_ARUDO
MTRDTGITTKLSYRKCVRRGREPWKGIRPSGEPLLFI